MNVNHRDRGATLPIVALVLPVLILMTAFAVDLGRQRSSRRTMQARADVIALDLARLADGRTEAEIEIGDLTHQSAQDALVQSASRNDITLAKITVDWGIWDGSAFDTGSEPFPNAVRVITNETTDYYFRPGSGDVERDAVATNVAPPPPPCSPAPCTGTTGGDPVGALVNLTVGAVAAGFQSSVPNSAALDAEVNALNARLAAHFGASVPNPGSAGFDLVGYRGLAVADVDLWRVAANAGFGSPNEFLASNITAGEFFDATASALDQQAAEGDPNAAGAATQLRRFRAQMGIDSNATLRLGDTIAFQHGGDDAAASGAVNVLDLLSGAADVISGTNFLAYKLASTVPGITSVNVSQQTITPAATELGLGLDESATNKQVRFQVNLVVAPLVGMTQPVTIPLVVEAATAVGTADRLTCATPSEDSEAEIFVGTSAVKVTLGTAVDLSAATLIINQGVLIQSGGLTVSALLNLGLSLATISGLNLSTTTTGTGAATLGGGNDQLVFLPNVPPVPYQRAPGGLGATSLGAQAKSSLVARLNNSLLGTTASTAMGNQLNYVFSNLDTTIIDPLLKASGVSIGGADLRAYNLQCFGPRLVN